MAVVLVGTLDTKGIELAFVRDLLRARGIATVLVDAGSLGPPAVPPDVPREEVFRLAGTTAAEAARGGDRGRAVSDAARGVAALVASRHAHDPLEGILAIGGSAGTVIGTSAMRALPFGLPKVMVSTLASGQTRPFVGGSDIAMFATVADLAGLNRLTRATLTNAALAMAGMVALPRPEAPRAGAGPVVAASMFGVTTPCVEAARAALETAGAEVLVFHATGVGGQAMETLVRDGVVDGVLDLTTTELADELLGGILSAGPERLKAAARSGTPQVVSLGALDMVNFGPRDTVPERFAGRLFHAHNPSVTLMRTTPAENAALGARIAEVLRRASGPCTVLIPRGGLSALDAPGRPFYDPVADEALFRSLAEALRGHEGVRLEFRDEHINDPSFGRAAALSLLEMISAPEDPSDAHALQDPR